MTFYPLAGGEPSTALHFPKKPGTLVVDVTPDGARALVVDNLEKAYLWDVKAGRELWSCGKPNLESVLPLSADGKSFVLFDEGVQLRDAGTGKLIAKFPGWRADSQAGCQCPDASEEAGRRLDEVLKPKEGVTPDQLRHTRACEVLEGIGTADAQQVLRTGAAAPAGAC